METHQRQSGWSKVKLWNIGWAITRTHFSPLKQHFCTTAASHREIKLSWDWNTCMLTFISVRIKLEKQKPCWVISQRADLIQRIDCTMLKEQKTKRRWWASQILETSGNSYHPQNWGDKRKGMGCPKLRSLEEGPFFLPTRGYKAKSGHMLIYKYFILEMQKWVREGKY